jgi:hypothetical protein
VRAGQKASPLRFDLRPVAGQYGPGYRWRSRPDSSLTCQFVPRGPVRWGRLSYKIHLWAGHRP